MRVILTSAVALTALAVAGEALAQYARTGPARLSYFTQTYRAPSTSGLPAVFLYTRSDLNGRVARIERIETNLPSVEAASLVTVGESAWEICDGPAFTGRCAVVDGRINDLRDRTGVARIRSMRPAT